MYSNAAECTVFKEGVNHSSELFWAGIGTELAARTPSERLLFSFHRTFEYELPSVFSHFSSPIGQCLREQSLDCRQHFVLRDVNQYRYGHYQGLRFLHMYKRLIGLSMPEENHLHPAMPPRHHLRDGRRANPATPSLARPKSPV
jgi:hypothetical protein